MQARLDKRLPILEVADDCIISKMGDVTVALELLKPEIFTLGQTDYETVHASWVKALKVLPEGTIIHIQDTYRCAKVRLQQAKKNGSFLQEASDRYFDGRPFLNHRCRIFLTQRPEGRRNVTSGISGILRKTLVPADTLDKGKRRQFEECVSQFCRILEDTKFCHSRRVVTSELISTATRPGVIEQYCYLLEENESPVIKDIDLGETLRVGDQRLVLFTLADPEKLPGKCSPWINYDRYGTEKTGFPIGFAAGLGLLLPYDHIYNQYLVIGDQVATQKKLESKRLRLQSLANYSRENALARDAVNAFLNEGISEQRTAIRLHCNIMAWSHEPDEIKEIRNGIGAAMAGMDAIPHQETIGAPQLWWAGIPGNAGELPENECFDTFLEQGCCFLGMETNYRSTDSAFGLRFGDRLTGRPVQVNIEMQSGLTQNGNMFILSGSGGGKSYLLNHLCRSYYDLGMHIVMVDIGHSYRVLCELLGGCYLTYEEANPIRFNPFFLRADEIFDTEKKESVKSLLLALWKKPEEPHYRSEYVALSNGLQAYYHWLRTRPDIFPCFNSFYEYMEQEYVAILRREKVTAKEFDVENFLYVVRPYYKGGEYDFLLNASENLDLLSRRFIVFELDAIQNNEILFKIVTLVIVDVFLSKMRKLRGIPKMICIEEAWKAIANAGMAENILYWVKTLRKFMAKLVLVSQEVDDMVKSPIIRQAIINNSDIKILLDQSKFANRFGEIQELLGISDKQKAEILSINKAHDPGRAYKDCWIALGPTHSKVYRLETSWEEYLAYTSDQGEKVKIEGYAKKYGGMEEGIKVLAAELRSAA